MAAWFEPNPGFGGALREACVAQIVADMDTYTVTDADGKTTFDIDGFMTLAATRMAAIPDPFNGGPYIQPELLRNFNVRPYVETLASDISALVGASDTQGTIDLKPLLLDAKRKCDAVTAFFDRLYQVELPNLLLADFAQGELEKSVPVADDTSKETRYVRTTFANDWENESAPSPVSDAIEVGLKDTVTITVGAVPSGRNISHWRPYRSNVGSETAAFEYVPSANALGVPIATTTLTDAIANSALQEVCPSTIWAEPPAALAGLIGMANGIHLGYFGRTLCPSESFTPYAYPIEYRLTVEHDIVGLCAWEQSAFVGTKGKPYFVSGADAASLTARVLDSNQACVSDRSICATHLGPVYASPDGLCLARPEGVKVITAEHFTREEWQLLRPDSMIVQEHDGIVFMVSTQPTLLLWLDASDLATITEVGGKVSQWNDKSSAARHAVQATDTARGVRNTTRFASGGIEFAGAEGMTFTSLNLTTGTTIFFVCYFTSTNAAYTSLALAGGNLQLGVDYAAIHTATTPSNPTSSGTIGLSDGGAGLAEGPKNAVPTGKHIVEFVAVPASPASSKLRLDGVDQAVTSSGTSWDITVNSIGLQPFYSSNNNQFAEIRVYDGVLTPSECATIRTELETKWGL